MDWTVLTAFAITSLALAITPGPGVLFIVSTALSGGRKSGLSSVAGVALGNLGNSIAASIGLGTLFQAYPVLLTGMRIAGSSYLIFLGIRSFRETDPEQTNHTVNAPVKSGGSSFKDGLFVALLNPKTTVFFAAFLPQFIRPDASFLLQACLLGTLFVLIAGVTDSLYVFAAAKAAGLFASNPKSRAHARRVTATIYLGLGLLTALAGMTTKNR